MTSPSPVPLAIDPALFDPAAVAPQTAALNDMIVAKLDALPDSWSFPAHMIRERRARGLGAFPIAPRSPRARVIEIDGPDGKCLPLRIIAPDNPRGVFLHMHGGGWSLGTADMQDDRLERLATGLGLACVSVDYRLAPEHSYPAAPDDCEAAALWLGREAQAMFGTSTLFIGGESAGAQLALVTMLRLRDRHGLSPFAGASLIAGMYDLAGTPSARAFKAPKLILTTRDVERFVANYTQGRFDLADPDISPLYADLSGLPPLHLSVGTRDALLDDSLFLAARATAAGVSVDLKVWPGGAHVFVAFDFPMAHAALDAVDDFLRGLLGN